MNRVIEWSDKLLELLIQKKKEQTDLKFWLRQKNTNNRLEEGYWFQSTDKYISIGFSNMSSGNYSTQSISFMVWFDEEPNMHAKIEIQYKDNPDEKFVQCYQEIIKRIGDFKNPGGTNFQRFYKSNDILANLNEFLDIQLPIINDVINEMGLDDELLIPDNKFNRTFKKTLNRRDDLSMQSQANILIVNLTWNSKDWKELSEDTSGHKWIQGGNVPHESWNFDWNKERNNDKIIYGFAQFTNAPRVKGKNNFIIFYSKGKIIGFYGKTEVLKEPIILNDLESINLVAEKNYSIVLENKIDNIKEQGFLEDKERVGQIGFTYLKHKQTAINILNKSIELNPSKIKKLNSIKSWLLGKKNEKIWIFQGNPEIYDITKALKAGHLKSWKVAAHKDKIKIGDKVIIWQTGVQAGCYALAEVVSEVAVFEEESFEIPYYKIETDNENSERVKLKIEHYLADNPILWNDIKNDKVFQNFKAGNQGTNFTATIEEYNAILNWNNNMKKKYWLFSPGEQAFAWEEQYKNGIMGLAWDKLSDLTKYKDKDEIYDGLVKNYGGDGSKKNDTTANWEFTNTMQIGDIVIVKKGRSKLLGYGIVSSEYYYDNTKEEFKHCRKIDWKLKGIWNIDHSLVLKTLTDITRYNTENENYDKYYALLMDIMKENLKSKKTKPALVKPTNKILYGPPGTGKTFKLKEDFFPLYTTKESNLTQEEHFENILKDLTWWQVIAVALLDLKKAKVSEILKHKWVQQKIKNSNSVNARPTLWGRLQAHTIDSCEFVNVSSKSSPQIFNKTEDSEWEIVLDEVNDLAPELLDLRSSVNDFNPNPDKIIKRYRFTTFHQSFAYEDFIEGIKPIISEDELSGNIGYTIEDGIFKQICTEAENDPNNRYAIFIDEINRGNVSAIFGELITLIEPDKRKGGTNAMEAELPYSKKSFAVPSNLDIIGTMNTADRSVEALDTALRRRFSFEEIMPQYDLDILGKVEGFKLGEVLKTINERIEVLIDRDHTIGHSYFIGIDNTEDLKLAFKDKIIPLLQEYFYGDYGKIGLVLGNAFVQLENKKKEDKIQFAEFKDYENASDLNNSYFSLINIDEYFNIIVALKSLMNIKDGE